MRGIRKILSGTDEQEQTERAFVAAENRRAVGMNEEQLKR
jgi:hypothetical protein